jgi:peptidoglycan hydrolase-like amidase
MTIYLHKANRNVQHTLLQQSAGLLNATIEPPAPVPDPPPYEVQRAGLTEQLKDRWNTEVERMVQRIQTTDWTEQREIYEQKIGAAWNRLRQTEQAKELEQKVKDTIDSAKSDAKDGVEAAKGKVEAGKQKAKEPRLLDLK